MSILRTYFKNFILCGDINYHCLLCEESVKKTEDIDRHIRWEKHRKLIKKQTVIYKYRKDNVYKIGKYFYCAMCSFATASKDVLHEHLTDEIHRLNKEMPDAEPPTQKTIFPHLESTEIRLGVRTIFPLLESQYVRIGPFLSISPDEFHGIFNGRCMICDKAVRANDFHVNTSDHMVKLMNTHIIGECDQYYCRQLGSNKVQCFNCKAIVTDTTAADHLKNAHTVWPVIDKTVDLKQYYNIDPYMSTATCKYCKKTIPYKYTLMHVHKKTHKALCNPEAVKVPEGQVRQNDTPFVNVDHGKRRHELKMALQEKKYHIKLVEGGKKGYCSLCHVYVAATMKNIQQHVLGALHREHYRRHLESTQGASIKDPEEFHYKKPTFVNLFRTGLYENSVYYKDKGVISINNFLIDALSFTFLAPVPYLGKYKCYLCDEIFSMNNGDHFKRDSEHMKRFMAIKTIPVYKEEIIREVNPGQYHCGFCNIVYPSWKLLERHLRSWKHICHKKDASRMFEAHMTPELHNNEGNFLEFVQSIEFIAVTVKATQKKPDCQNNDQG